MQAGIGHRRCATTRLKRYNPPMTHPPNGRGFATESSVLITVAVASLAIGIIIGLLSQQRMDRMRSATQNASTGLKMAADELDRLGRYNKQLLEVLNDHGITPPEQTDG